MLTYRDLAAVCDDGLDRFLKLSLNTCIGLLFLGACHNELLIEECVIAGKAKVSVESLEEPESVIGPPAGLFADPVEIMVCIAVFVNVLDPACEHLLNEVCSSHACEIVHGSEDVLDLPESDLTITLLCPVQRS